MSMEPTRTNPTTAAGDRGTASAATAPATGFQAVVATATVSLAHRRGSDIVDGDVIALPDEVFVPVPARLGQRRTWVWRSKPSRLLDNAHRWRWVYDVDQLDEDETGFAESLPLGLRLLRVSDDHPDQGQEYRSMVIAVGEYDLVDIQVRTEHAQRQRPDPSATATNTGDEPDQRASTADRIVDFTVRDATVRVFDRSTDVGSDDASDMYVLDVFGVSVLVRLRTTRTHPATRPQLYVHVDNESREPTDLAVEVSNGGETHYRI